MNKYQFSLKTESGLGKVYYYCYKEVLDKIKEL